MSSTSMEAEDPAGTMSTAQRYLTLMTVVLGSSLYGTALLTTSTILPQMQGALSATQDEVAWVMTFNILATAVVTPMTGWLVSRFGSRRVMVWSVGWFTLATLLCGMAQSLEGLVLWRILQGGAGAPLVPLSQSILFATFPRRQHSMVMSIFGMAVAVAPVFGPVYGGYLAEAHSWRWSFYMLVPIGIAATIGMAWTLPSDNQLTKVRFDWTGFIALATALAAIQLVLARGARLDWFDSTEIVVECLIAGIAFYVFLIHSLGARNPFVNLKLLTDRNYAIGLALVTIYGMLNFTPMVLLPPLLQQQAGYPDALVGQVIGSRGLGMLVGFMFAGLMNRLDPRLTMAFGFGLQTVAGLWMLTFDLNVTMEILVINSVIQGFAVGVVWVPITAVAFGTLDAKHYAEASAIFHLLRNIGSSFFISLSIAEIVRTSGTNYSRMTEMISPYNRALTTPGLTGGWNFDTVPGLAKVAKEIARQSMMIGYLNAFTMYTVTSGLAVLFVLMVRGRKTAA
ncbi:DHA2 family efflux MFS transporter permease subunit [Bradyrhizobium sp. JYMT SZCCT0428]|uniref:DHA2 family efflux MFS transporter permease subunit n=1 Tax=Bradyrhizobium sp. JYMT SZCCT0428 TaxID=2807673 RepID=UPI001BA96E4B|nr:DHA2 family efflux MFS transporter permease subunit [Bradyrhizobium sp. JYMT SZCCT0428]MBR1152363.1 DHA2 family efflux MFS transporter permease subunit [Bradyrhizobium sp. JYMT SZCCT0428]